MEILQNIWTYIVAGISWLVANGLTIGLGAVLIKGSIKKKLAEINVKQIEDKAVENGVNKIKETTFTHSIQPVVESGLQKVNEKSAEYIQKSIKDINDKLKKIIEIQKIQASYFENSLIPEDKKEEMKDKIEEAETLIADTEEKVETKVIFDEPKNSKEKITIER